MSEQTRTHVDFAAYKRAFVAQDASARLAFFAESAEWIEYKHTHPPRAPPGRFGVPRASKTARRFGPPTRSPAAGDREGSAS